MTFNQFFLLSENSKQRILFKRVMVIFMFVSGLWKSVFGFYSLLFWSLRRVEVPTHDPGVGLFYLSEPKPGVARWCINRTLIQAVVPQSRQEAS